MKQLFLVLSLLVPFHFVEAQPSSSFVEVAVADTVIASADQFVFHLMIQPDQAISETTSITNADVAPPRTRSDYMRAEREMRLRQKQLLDSLEKRFLAKGFAAMPLSIQDMMASRGYGNHYLVYQIPSAEALKRFHEVLKDERSINPVLQSVSSKHEDVNQKRLYAKLIAKARSKAESIAALSGKKISGIMSVSEHAADMGSWSGYPPVMAVTQTMEQTNTLNTHYPMSGRLLVRFSWN